MKPLLVLLSALLLVGCNPAARCAASADCGGGVCSGGFCTDQQGVVGNPDGSNAAERADVDGPDAGTAEEPDAGQPWDAGDSDRLP